MVRVFAYSFKRNFCRANRDAIIVVERLGREITEKLPLLAGHVHMYASVRTDAVYRIIRDCRNELNVGKVGSLVRPDCGEYGRRKTYTHRPTSVQFVRLFIAYFRVSIVHVCMCIL